MQERSAEFTELHDLGIFCGTWNVNGKKPDPEEDALKSILRADA